jgi:acyl-CoA synthetase (AMP-forming)/AMP-acid ligase II
MNSLEVVDAYGAAMKGGFVVAPLNARLEGDEIARVIIDSGAKVLFVDPDRAAILDKVKDKLDGVELFVSVNGPIPWAVPYSHWTGKCCADEPKVELEKDDPYLIIYTSGTTGDPKGACYSHIRRIENTKEEVRSLDVKEGDRNLLLLPLFHIATSIVWTFFYAGATTIISPVGSFNPKEAVEEIAREKATFVHIVPTQLVSILELGSSDWIKEKTNSLTTIYYAASPMPLELLKKGMKCFGPIFVQAYGQSESGPDITILKKEDHILGLSAKRRKVLSSAGKPVSGAQVRIVDLDGQDVPQGEIGEIVVRSSTLMVGYWKKPELTSERIIDGWLYTGDIGYGDEEGYIYIVDRKKEMIVSGGENVFPREVEEVLYCHPAILEAAVIGLPDPKWIEAVHAVVSLKQGAEASSEEIRDFCKANLAGYKSPKSIEIFKSLPKSATGKLMKKVLKEELLSKLNSKTDKGVSQ